ncbi:FkbM family methyltransferase [Ferruginibacter paludis]|uniref:FkbM family methyltransferase n=1 Tax=Ferruginibacter paludis TaxID=1310417 RepID=UPI0025B36C5F|nr:FkbM family methyltransferase [Ferruginibacter paludis]MDN3655866.1 FkbM family methyltransferase [Ferruginibacter paludis]
MRKAFLPIVCYFNRNLRYGNSQNRYLQFLVIRSRSFLKNIIKRNDRFVNELGSKQIVLRHAGKMELQTNDYIDHWLYTGADFEPHVVRLFLKILKKGNNVLDIGANIGYFSLIASKLVGVSGKVYSFEPTPLTLHKLNKNISLNNSSNIMVYNKAVSDHNGKALFKIPIGMVKNSGRASFRNIEENNLTVEVQTITLDSILDEIQPVHLIKMDIEGAEAMALKGMKNLIKRDRPIFIMELSDCYLQQLGESASNVLNFYREQAYRIFIAGEEIKEISNNTELKDHQYDILCIPIAKFAQYKSIVN